MYGGEAEDGIGGDGGGGEEVPREVLVPALPPDAAAVTEWLCRLRGARVDLRVPQRGDKRALLETVEQNAKQAFTLHKLRRAADLTARSRALQELQDLLGLAQAPLRIECFDVSNLQGTSVVASMVVFEDGLARKSEYRRFAIRGVEGQDDVASMYEVVARRFRRYLEERQRTGELEAMGSDGDDPTTDSAAEGPARPAAIDPETGRARKFAYPPNLVVVDGGPPQVGAATRALADLGINGDLDAGFVRSAPGGAAEVGDDVAVCGLAKRLEEVWLPGRAEPVILPRTSEGLYLLQRVRDEAHRFAITYHRQRRSRSMVESTLDGIAGLGETRRKALLRHFGSLKRLRAASIEEVASVPGVGRRTAEAVVGALAGASPAPAVDPATGEIREA